MKEFICDPCKMITLFIQSTAIFGYESHFVLDESLNRVDYFLLVQIAPLQDFIRVLTA